MSITIDETFRLHATTARVWSYLSDPVQVVNCVAGAEILSVEGPDAFRGRVKAKVGPVSTSYAGIARLERDDAACRLTLSADAKESAGSGSARVAMTASVTDAGDGMVEVHVHATVDIVGRVMQFGRPMVEMVSKQLFADFVACVRTTLEQQGTASVAAEATLDVPAPQPTRRTDATLRPLPSLLRAIARRIQRWLGRKMPA